MVDRLERQGEMWGWEGGYERRNARADTPLPDDGGRMAGHRRGSSEGIMRSGSGSGKSVERVGGAARKEVRWSKDVDYEG